MMQLSRRQFLKVSAGTVAVAAVADKALALTALQPVVEVDNPLGEYPDRSWERVYHDQYRYDSSFTWCCSPNDTHGCRVRAFVRNGVVMRVEQNYDHQTYEDLYGNRGTSAHNPRAANALTRTLVSRKTLTQAGGTHPRPSPTLALRQTAGSSCGAPENVRRRPGA